LSDEFESCLWKVDRARKHADDLEAEIESFWATSPCGIEANGHGSYRVNRMDPLPEAIPLIAGDAAHNIRAALDHFAWAATSPQERGVHTCFPVWNSSDTRTHAKWQKQVERQMKGASGDLISAIAELEPWQDGRDSLLWAIHELDRVDKHRILLSAAVALTRIALDGDSYDLNVVKKYSGFDPTGPLYVEPVKWIPFEGGAELPGLPAGPELGVTRTTLQFAVMLAEPPMLRGISAVRQLRILAGLTEKIIRELVQVA
jgi:hypothetical protein